MHLCVGWFAVSAHSVLKEGNYLSTPTSSGVEDATLWLEEFCSTHEGFSLLLLMPKVWDD